MRLETRGGFVAVFDQSNTLLKPVNMEYRYCIMITFLLLKPVMIIKMICLIDLTYCYVWRLLHLLQPF